MRAKRSMPYEACCEATRSRAEVKLCITYTFLRSLKDSSKTYIGYTTDIEIRLKTHNLGRSSYTKQDRPWKLVTNIAFDCEEKAINFEKYVKVGSGNAFAKKRLW
jgi:putative endonuclease